MTVMLSDGRGALEGAVGHILGTFAADLDAKRGILLKPNIVFPVREESREITPLTLVRTLIRALRERYDDVDIIIAEGVAAGCDASENFRVSGYAALGAELDVPLIDLHSAERERVPWKFGMIKLPRLVLERNYINLPILKPSSACIISGASKNQKGLLLAAVKKQFHRHGLHDHVAELNAVVQPALTILDGSRFFGPNVLISGNNCGEIDATVCRFLGIEEPEHVRLSRSAGVFSPGYAVLGDDLKLKRGTARPVAREYKSMARLRLWSNPTACTMCRRVFHDIQHSVIKRPDLVAGAKLLALSIKGAEILMGSNPQWRKEYGTVICVGECTRRLAKKEGYVHIPGCPPTVDDFLDRLP